MTGRSPVFSLICWLVALEELCATDVAELLELTTGATLLDEFTTGTVALLEELLTLLPLLLDKGLLSALTVCCLNGPPWGKQIREEERTKARVLQCQEDMPFGRKFPEKETPESLGKDCIQMFSSHLSICCCL